MTKDELKDRISMALKDPILQQGFEIICKENAELKKHKRECETSLCAAEYQSMREKFSKARALLEKWLQTERHYDDINDASEELELRTETEVFMEWAK